MDAKKRMEQSQNDDWRVFYKQSWDKLAPAAKEQLKQKNVLDEDAVAKIVRLVSNVNTDALRNQLTAIIHELSQEVNTCRNETLKLRGLLASQQAELETKQDRKSKRKGKR